MSQESAMDAFTDIIAQLNEVSSDSNVPKNVRFKFQEIASMLNSQKEHSIKIHEALNIMEGVSSDVNLEPFTRTQVYAIVSMLENMQ